MTLLENTVTCSRLAPPIESIAAAVSNLDTGEENSVFGDGDATGASDDGADDVATNEPTISASTPQAQCRPDRRIRRDIRPRHVRAAGLGLHHRVRLPGRQLTADQSQHAWRRHDGSHLSDRLARVSRLGGFSLGGGLRPPSLVIGLFSI